jgi:Flp pilus assembly protein TadB
MLEKPKVGCSMHDKNDLEHLRTEFEERQSPTTFPETLRAGRSVDEFLWKGDPKATPVQRVGLFIFAVMFLFVFVGFVVFTIIDHYWLNKLMGLAFATLSGIVGFRLLLNAFRHKKHLRVSR